jgi:hypothetical protein
MLKTPQQRSNETFGTVRRLPALPAISNRQRPTLPTLFFSKPSNEEDEHELSSINQIKNNQQLPVSTAQRIQQMYPNAKRLKDHRFSAVTYKEQVQMAKKYGASELTEFAEDSYAEDSENDEPPKGFDS